MSMEMEKAMKKLRNIAKAIVYLLKKGISNSKLFLDFSSLLIKRIAKLNSSQNDAVFSHSQHYEFSCSNSPVAFFHHIPARRASKLLHRRAVLEMVNGGGNNPESPVLPAAGRQLRITDSPIPMKENEEEDEEAAREVNMAADEFIKRFYRELRNQKYLALDSPYHP